MFFYRIFRRPQLHSPQLPSQRTFPPGFQNYIQTKPLDRSQRDRERDRVIRYNFFDPSCKQFVKPEERFAKC